MACWLDDEEIRDILEQFENDSTSCIFRIMDLRSHDFMGISPQLSKKLKEIIKQIEEVQDAMEEVKAICIEEDTTEYFDGKYFSNMGWIMVSNFLSDYVAAPVSALTKHVTTRTKGNPNIFSAVNRLVKQGLIERRRLMVPRMEDTQYVEGFETCIVLTSEGRMLLEDMAFIYNHEYTNGKEPVEKYTDNIIPFRREEDDSTNTDDSS